MLEATNDDMQFSSSTSQSSIKVYVTESDDSNFSCYSISEVKEENIEYDIDTSTSKLLINMSNQSPNICMPEEDFSSLSPEVRQSWSKIPNDMKTFMLRSRNGNSNEVLNKNNKDIYKTVKPPSFSPMKFTKSHLYEILTKLISETSLFEQNEVDVPKDEIESE